MLLNHPEVIDAAVCAIYDDAQATEIPLAYVSLSQETAGLSGPRKQQVLDAIKIWMDSQLAGYKKLRGGVFICRHCRRLLLARFLGDFYQRS